MRRAHAATHAATLGAMLKQTQRRLPAVAGESGSWRRRGERLCPYGDTAPRRAYAAAGLYCLLCSDVNRLTTVCFSFSLARRRRAHTRAHNHARTHRAWVLTGDIATLLVLDLSLSERAPGERGEAGQSHSGESSMRVGIQRKSLTVGETAGMIAGMPLITVGGTSRPRLVGFHDSHRCMSS